MAFQHGLLNPSPVQRMHLMQVDSVQRWMDELMLMTECECMCILQSKPISVEDDSQSELMFSPQENMQNSLEMLLKRAWIISTELTKIVQKLEKNKWRRIHTMTMRTNCHVRSMIKEYNTFTKTSSGEMHQYESILMDKCSELTDITERCTQTNDDQALSSMKLHINDTLTYVGQYFSQLINLALMQEIKNLVKQLEMCDNVQSMESAIHRLFSLTKEGSRLCQLIAQEGAVVMLFKICRQDCYKGLYPSALRTLASVCCVEEGIYQLEKTIVNVLKISYDIPVSQSYSVSSLIVCVRLCLTPSPQLVFSMGNFSQHYSELSWLIRQKKIIPGWASYDVQGSHSTKTHII
ncbi:Hypothetical predicted protein [Pelobates cultripes]|uniref:Uncharacterized protein n=1 Tax=Pelobates cultripes TaxID=61616 RepID=A0AAD1TEY6_PELCU|nr:Hypothetical predicted protein [Pelobates cultripes]